MTEFITTEELDRRPVRDGRCRQCGERIVGRPNRATTCLLHRQYPGPPSRSELVALMEEHEAVVTSLRKALVTMDKKADR